MSHTSRDIQFAFRSMNGKIYNNDIFSVNIVSGPSKVLDTVIERTETRRFQFAASHEVRIL